ncbi:MAG: NAD(P)/FAD-dependent oxidoreductase [Ardenticatenales bacterium]|nr:NAD(P)/FAD-dependent oxidoreductase [Ardenticatenales bacterium]
MHALRRLILGAAIGFLVSLPLLLILALAGDEQVSLATVGGFFWVIVAALLIGSSYALLFVPRQGGGAEHMATGFILGLILWFVWALTLQPLLLGRGHAWGAGAAQDAIPKLFLYLLQGGGSGFLYGLLFPFINGPLRLWPKPAGPVPISQRVVIVGGGYAGVAAAQALEKELDKHPEVAIYLISQNNYLIHTPMLSEVSASSVNAQNISPTLRSFFHRVQVIQGDVAGVDLAAGQLQLTADTRSAEKTLSFDQLIMAVGSVPNFFGNESIAQNAFTLKSLDDAVLIRNQIIDMFERADLEPDPAQRRQLLTFVVAGGGFAGVELLGGINDFARGICAFYPNVHPADLRTVLVHSRDRILPELSEKLGKFAQEKLAERGVEFQLGVRVTGARRGAVLIGDGAIPSHTFVWTAGNQPSPILQQLGLPLTERGQLAVDNQLQVSGADNVWAAGDCAQVPDLTTGGTAPPTAQHALREGKTVGYNVAATLLGKPTKPFKFKMIGSLAALGHQLAVAEIFGIRFSGFLAWLMWRGIYLSKLPTLQKQVRVLLDWLLDIFFPPDIVQTVNFSRPDPVRQRYRQEQDQTIVDLGPSGGQHG